MSWVGGKSRLSGTIIPLMPDHRCYAEPFAGAAWVLFRKPPSKCEVINDRNDDLVAFYRVIQNHLDEFLRCAQWTLASREQFRRFKDTDPASLTDVHRAVRFYCLVKMAHGSRIASPTFGTQTTARPRFNAARIKDDLLAAHRRLANVTVENLDYGEFLARYDRGHTFFYVDPPYYGCESYYGKGLFERADFERLRDQLAGIKGRFLLSINDAPAIRELFGGFEIVEAPTSYSLGVGGGRKPVVELLIANYDLAKK